MKLNFGLLPAVTLLGSLSVITATQIPILLVPGLTGSQLWGTVSDGNQCKSATPRLLWLPDGEDCTSTLELQYDQSTNTYSDKQGVSVSVPGFGETSTVECLDDDDKMCEKHPELQYFKKFVDYFAQWDYYQRGVTIRAAPYDWRLAADSLATRGYFDKLKALVEEMYNRNNTPVALVAHSMGGVMSLYFLNEVVTEEWKDKYIKVYIPLSGAFGGFSEKVKAVVSGRNSFSILPLKSLLPEIERSLESIYWLMPSAEIFGDQVLVQTPNANYTAMDYEQMFTTFANYSLGWTKYNATSSINAGYKYPGVPTHCFYGSNLSTPLTYVYSSNDPTQILTEINGTGDGLLNKVGLEVCLRWANSTNSTGFQSRAFPGVEHIDIVKNTTVLDAIAEIVMAPNGSVMAGPPSGSVIAQVNIYSTMILLAAAFIIRAVM